MIEHGLMKPLTTGIYYYLPLLQRSIEKTSKLISRFMSRADAQQVTIPILTPANLWKDSGKNCEIRNLKIIYYENCFFGLGRFSQYEDVLFLTKDKTQHDLLLGPVNLDLKIF